MKDDGFYYAIQEQMKGTESWYDVAYDAKRERLGSAVQRANELRFKNHMFKYRVVRRVETVVSEQGMVT